MQRRFGSTVEESGLAGLSYIEALKYRVSDLLVRSQSDHPSDGTPGSQHGTTPSSQSHGRRNTDASVRPDVLDQPRNDLHDTMQEASYLSLTAMAERTDRQPFPTEGLSFLTLLYAAIGVSGANPESSTGKNAALSGPLAEFRRNAVHGLHAETDHTALLPPYSKLIQNSYPFITKPELDSIIEGVVQAQKNATIGSLIADQPELVFLHNIVLATSILLSPDHTYKEILATELTSNAIKLLPSVFDLANDVSIVRCLTALTIYSMFTTFGGSSWHLLGLTMTRCVSSGMHTSRMSDLNSEEEEKRKRCRTFWTLYVLDTYLSTTLDRPFCLGDNDVMVSPPHSSAVEEQGDLHTVVEHAQLLRSIRQQPDTDPWIHYINLRHWYESVHPHESPSQATLPTLAQSRLLVRGLVELIKQPSLKENSQRGLILHGAEPDLKNFLHLLEGVLYDQGGVTSYDAFRVFAAGVALLQLPVMPDPNMVISDFGASGLFERQRTVSQAINILTTLAARYPPVRSLRDVLMEYYAVATNHHQLAAHTRLRELIDNSEIRVSLRLQDLMLGRQV